MVPSLVAAIHSQLAHYLAGSFTLNEFYDWLVANTWDIERRLDLTAEELSYAIKLLIAEYSDGSMTEDELRRMLMEVSSSPVPLGSRS